MRSIWIQQSSCNDWNKSIGLLVKFWTQTDTKKTRFKLNEINHIYSTTYIQMNPVENRKTLNKVSLKMNIVFFWFIRLWSDWLERVLSSSTNWKSHIFSRRKQSFKHIRKFKKIISPVIFRFPSVAFKSEKVTSEKQFRRIIEWVSYCEVVRK